MEPSGSNSVAAAAAAVVVAATTQPSSSSRVYTGRSLDQQVDASPNHSNYSNLTNNNSSSSGGSSSATSPLAALAGGGGSGSVSSSSSSSAPQYSEDVRRRNGAVASTKTCEVDLGEAERDSFSPMSSPDGADGAEIAVLPTGNGGGRIDNKTFEVVGKMKPPSKEEKQRQNEEIVCMETSTVSTETGSWESVYPTATTTAPATVLQLETDATLPQPSSGLKHSLENGCGAVVVTADTGSLFKDLSASTLLREFEQQDALSTSGTSACFIDASSLRDEDELLSFPSIDGPPPPLPLTLGDEKVASLTSPTQQLEDFHKAFAKCKSGGISGGGVVKVEMEPLSHYTTHNSSSSSSGADSPQKLHLESTNNLSDEEKLWKREQEMPILAKDTKDADATEASVSLAADADSSDSSLSVRMRRVREERRPATATTTAAAAAYQFHHNNTPQFSVHPLGSSPKFAPHHQHQHGDISYTTDYSSSSPAPSLAWQHPPVHAPDMPHNSMVHIEPVSSNNSSIHRDFTYSSSLSHHRDSGAYCSDATDSPVPLPRTPKRSKFDEANPIVSGGASIEDFHVKPCDSPSLKRRTDICPIVSGGFVSLDFAPTRPLNDDDDDEDGDADGDADGELDGVELRVKAKPRKPVSGIASWVVDMSDCRPERRKSTSSASSVEARFRERSDSNSSHKSGCGFYVSLDDMEKKPKDQQQQQQSAVKALQPLSRSYTAPKSTGFFVNLSQSDYKREDEKDNEQQQSQRDPPPPVSEDKKNIFSMFIDIGEKKSRGSPQTGAARKEPFSLAQRLSSSLSSTQKRGDEMRSSASSTETLMTKSATQKAAAAAAQLEEETMTGESKSLDYRCNLEPPLTVAALRRMSQQQRQQLTDPSKRHSWGTNSNSSTEPGTDYKRSISLTANGNCNGCDGDGGKHQGEGLMSIIDKLPIISKASSLSIDSSLSPYEDYTGSKSGGSSVSNVSARNSISGGEREAGEEVVAARVKRRRRDVQINETFDKSSVASVSEGVLSKDMSPASTTDTDDLTFQQDEELAQREVALHPLQHSSSSARTSSIMETILEAKETSSPKKTNTQSNGHTMESLHATIEKQKQLLETVNEHAEQPACFVKLSDMDKPAVLKHELNSPDAMSKSAGNRSSSSQMNRFYRDESRARPHSWAMSRSSGCGNSGNGNALQQFTNSADNLRSLSRLFPNFSKELSNSMPNDIIAAEQQQLDYIQTDLSADSSLASSFSRSGMDESSISCRQPRRLGEDLLKMFLQELATDMVVEVHGRRIRAHKCILRSRCQYFAAMLAGHGTPSVVALQGYSYAAVHFALCHIYSGASHPPDGISLMELAALADLLGLEGLKEVTSHALKTNYCHNFHKPCSGCIDGILQVLPVALNHALDDLYRKCLRWTCRHYLKVWPTRHFAQLPADILGRCRQQIVAYLTSETVLDTVLDCDHLLAQLSAYRWGHVCEQLVRDILEAAYTYVGDHFASLIASDAFLSLGHDRSRHIPRLETILLQTASTLTADQACRSYQRVTRLNTVLQAKVIQMPVNMGELARELQGLQEEELDWDPEYIRLVSALLSAVEQCLIRQCSRAMRVTAWQRMDLDLRKKIQTLARLTEPLDLKRNSKTTGVGKAFSFGGGNTRTQDLVQIKLAIQAQSKRAQDTHHLYKATQTLEAGNVQTHERGVQANHEPRENKLLKSNSRAYVPQSQRSASQTTSERNSINLHRRTQSEAPPTLVHKKTTHVQVVAPPPAASEPKVAVVASIKAPLKLSEIRPRYLEPRKPRSANAAGPVRSATSSSIPGTQGHTKGRGLHISSSDSSRNSSPAAVRRAGNKSTNMSMDSLSSPARRAKSAPRIGKPIGSERYASDHNIDSLAESMKSSVITNKTISHESLSSNNKLARAKQFGIKANTATATNGVRINAPRATVASNKSTRQLKQNYNNPSNGSSPSSVHTTKSATSRLSSVSSTMSTRDLFKQRSISVPAAGDNVPSSKGRHSFLSAKSREILAKRAEKNKMQQQQQQQQQQQAGATSSGDERSGSQQQQQQRVSMGPMRSASHSAVTTMLQQHNLRNSLPSNIPTRRPNSLQLKKTTTTGATMNGVKPTTKLPNTTTTTNGINGGVGGGGIYKAAHAVKQKLDLLIDEAHKVGDPMPMQLVETKLQRSSTFCKESADMVDLDASDQLHIIE